MNEFKNLEELKYKFNWGAFFLTWIWGLVNNTYITLIALPIYFIPKLGGLLNLLLAIYFGIKGNEWALKNKKFKSELYFLKFQKIIAIIGLMVSATLLTLMIIWSKTTKLYPSTVNLELIRQQTMLPVFILCILLFTIYIVGIVFIIKISIKKKWDEACINPYIIHCAAAQNQWNDKNAAFVDIWKKSEHKLDKYLSYKNIENLISNFKDSPSHISGWYHDFFCPECASSLIFDINNTTYEKAVFKCSNCHKEVKGEKYLQAWVYEYRYKYSQKLNEIINSYKTGNEKALEFFVKYIDFYADNYNKFPIHGEHKGKGKIMAQSLDEAIFGINILRAIYSIKNDIVQEKIDEWYSKLFKPMVNLLLPQADELHNISFWIWCFIGMVGTFFEQNEFINKAINGEYGIKEQLKQGLTEDFLWHEGSIHYHYYMLEALTYFCEFHHNIQPDNELEEIMKKMYSSPLRLSYDSYHLPSLNDGWYPITLDSYKKQIDIAKSFCHLNFKRNKKMKDTAFNKHIGIINKPFKIMLKSGSLVPVHMHMDLLSVIIPEFSEDIGTSGYGTPLNDWYKSCYAHNSINVDGEQPRKIINTELNEIKDGYEAVISDKMWADISAKRSIKYKKNTVEDITIISSDTEHCYDWTFHSIGIAIHNCKEINIGKFDTPIYKHFQDVKKIETHDDFVISYRNNNGKTLTVKVKSNPNLEIYLATTPDNPAITQRNTILLRQKGKEAVFDVSYKITKKK